VADVQRNFKPHAERLDKREVAVRFLSAQAVVDVDRRQPDAESIAWQGVSAMQQQQQCHRIRTSGDGGTNSVSRADVAAVQCGLWVCHYD
jgi:hypothetical protein